MTEQEAGQGETLTGTSGNGQLVVDLQAKLVDAEATITRLRGTQSANDRTIGEQKTLLAQHDGKFVDLEAQLKAVKTDYETASTTVADLNTKVQAAGTLNAELEAMKQRNNRLLIAASKASQSPIIAALITNNALPQTETVEEFATALDAIIGQTKDQAFILAQGILAGSIPSPAAAGGADTPEAMIKRGEALIKNKKIAEGIAMIQQGEKLRAGTT
jgi:chromosome segregation ATPase